MENIIIHKRTDIPYVRPEPEEIREGEIVINTKDVAAYTAFRRSGLDTVTQAGYNLVQVYIYEDHFPCSPTDDSPVPIRFMPERYFVPGQRYHLIPGTLSDKALVALPPDPMLGDWIEFFVECPIVFTAYGYNIQGSDDVYETYENLSCLRIVYVGCHKWKIWGNLTPVIDKLRACCAG